MKNQSFDEEFIARYDNDSSTDEVIRASEIADAYSIAILHANGRGHKEIYVWPNSPSSGIGIDEGYLWKNDKGVWVGEWGSGLYTQPMIDPSMPTAMNQLYCPQCLSQNILADIDSDEYGDVIKIECQNCGCVAEVEPNRDGTINMPLEFFECDIIKEGAGYSIDTLIHYTIVNSQSEDVRAILERSDVRRWIWKYLTRLDNVSHGNGPALEEMAEWETVYDIYEFLELCHNKESVEFNSTYNNIMNQYDDDHDSAWLQLLDEAYNISNAIQKDVMSKAKKKRSLSKRR